MGRAGAAQNVARHEQQGVVVVEPFATVLPELFHSLSKDGQRFGRDVEAQDVAARARQGDVARTIPAGASQNEPFDLPDRTASCRVEPGRAQFVVSSTRRVAQDAFGVLKEAAVAEVSMRFRAQCAQEQRPFLGIERGSPLRQPRQRFVRLDPFRCPLCR
jgi:hypothetical protein